MAEQFSGEGSSSTSFFSGESSDSNIELNIKTLDSRIFKFPVDRNMPVSAFKEKIANAMGISVGQQRLIFRGKVLKDEHPLSEYHVENGDTLHLVERQPTQSQPSSASGGVDPSGGNVNQGSDTSAGPPRSRIGQISHSVVLGTFNVGDQGEGAVPDVSRVISAVLNSIGLGGLNAANGSGNIQAPMSFNVPGRGPHGIESEATGAGSRNQAGNQPSSGQSFSNQPIQSTPQVVQIPLAAATAAIPIPSLNAPLPDSLNTLLEFMTRMEQSFAQNGYQPNSPSPNLEELGPNARGLPSQEALSIVLRHAERLLGGQSVAAISHIAGRLEQEGGSSDPSVRGQIQAEASQTGMAMQHLGALFLELGRTMLTLRMGQSPGQAFVNAGPAVYISPSGPNPIMVQPFPLQTNSLFGGPVPPSNPVAFGPVGIGSPPRHINIHIHAGGSSIAPIVSALGSRANNSEGMLGQRGDTTGSGGSGASRPASSVAAASFPVRPTGLGGSHAPPSNVAASTTQPNSESAPASSLISEINSRLRNLAGNIQEGRNQMQSAAQADLNVENPAVGSAEATVQLDNMAVDRVGEPAVSSGASLEESEHKSTDVISRGPPSCPSGSSPTCSSEDAVSIKSEGAASHNEKHDVREESHVPKGLGLGSLERKRRGRQSKPPAKEDNGSSSAPLDQDQLIRTSGQQILQSLLSQGLSVNREEANNQPMGASAVASTQVTENSSQERQDPDSQVDMGGLMSQVLHSPALNGLLSGVSEQTGVGSPDALRNMMQQLTQSPVMMNAVNQIARQVDHQDLGSVFAGMGGQGGRIDLSRMVQQMMPIVSQALGGVSNGSSLFPEFESEFQRPSNENRPNRDYMTSDSVDQVNLEHVISNIEDSHPPLDIFNSMIENASRLYGSRNDSEDIVVALRGDENLAREYIELLRRDVRQRLQGDSRQV
ncbi:ubiquitin-like domain-containing protein CIP73 isoform X3 [Syzygium oleosum]|uniref:ubiquitin-like domain-containing protein CIP73 isoform X3 n=1 Tax=Syzygium oleosum TaxID=219896 RepID=UPI0024BB4ED8|nr:ubiquitin-like domain-containing protein CIP73 isoform X3 [Syzygium oleosum]